MRLNEVLRQCSEIERYVARVYERFAEQWTDGEIGSFWRRMALTEKTHAEVLEAASEYVDEDRSEPLDAGDIARIRGYVKGVTSIRTPCDLDEALRTALEVERMELDRVYAVLVGLIGEGFLRMSRTIGESLAALAEHHDSLSSAIERFGEDPRLLAEASRWGEAAAKDSIDLEESLREALRALSGENG